MSQKTTTIARDHAHTITSVIVWCDNVEAGYRIVELRNGQFAFRWGNIAASVGDVLPVAAIEEPTSEEGVEVFDTYEEAEQAYRECAECFLAYSGSGERTHDEMIAAL